MWTSELPLGGVVGLALIVGEALLIVWLLVRRASRRRAKLLLEERLRFETLLSELSAGLIHVAAADLDPAIERGLGQIVTFLGVDRGTLDASVDGGPGARISSGPPGLEPLPRVMEGGQFPWTTAQLRHGAVVRFARVDELPASAAIDRASYERAGTRSHVSFPLCASGPLLGVLSFDSVVAAGDPRTLKPPSPRSGRPLTRAVRPAIRAGSRPPAAARPRRRSAGRSRPRNT